jgi:hypothetical protein
MKRIWIDSKKRVWVWFRIMITSTYYDDWRLRFCNSFILYQKSTYQRKCGIWGYHSLVRITFNKVLRLIFDWLYASGHWPPWEEGFAKAQNNFMKSYSCCVIYYKIKDRHNVLSWWTLKAAVSSIDFTMLQLPGSGFESSSATRMLSDILGGASEIFLQFRSLVKIWR